VLNAETLKAREQEDKSFNNLQESSGNNRQPARACRKTFLVWSGARVLVPALTGSSSSRGRTFPMLYPPSAIASARLRVRTDVLALQVAHAAPRAFF
jgi:hypothetical protein